MFEAYAIGISLKVHNLVSPQLVLLMKDFEKLDMLAVNVGKTIGKLSVDTAGLRSLTTATNATNRALERANISASAFRNHVASINQTGNAIGFAAANRGPPRLPPPGGGGGGGGRGPAGPGGGLHGGNLHLGPGGIGLGTVGMATGGGFWPLMAGAASIYAGKALFEVAKELNTEQNRFRLFGMTEGQNQEAFKYAANMRVFGTTQIDRLAAMREAQGVFRESGLSGSEALRGSKLAAPILAKLDFLASSLDDESRATMHTSNLAMLRYVESSGGLKSPAEFNRIADFGYKLNVSSGNTVNWEQLRQFKARAGAAGFHLTDDAMARLEPVIAEMKGGAVGFGLSTSFNRLTGATRVPNQIAHELVDQGIWDKSSIVWNRAGGIKQFTRPGGPLSKEKIEMLSTNPELFYERYIKPMYDKMKLDAAEIARQNVMIFGSTGGRNMTLVDNQLPNIHNSVSALKKTLGMDAAGRAAETSLSGQQIEFEAAWKDFKTQWGTTILPFFTGLLKGGAALLRPTDADTSWYTKLFKGMLNPYGAIWDMVASPTSDPGPSRFVGKGGGALHVHTNLNLDGRKIATTVTRHLASGGPQTGPSTFDPSMNVIPVGGY